MSDVAADQLRSIIERVENVNEQIAGLNADKVEIFAEAKSNGYDLPALKEIIKRRAKDPAKREELEAIVETYESALRGVR